MKPKKAAFLGLMVALAMILSYVESLIPVFAAVPGVKLGLTNVVVLTALVGINGKYAFLINVIRIILVGFTFGNLFSMVYSLAGGMLSFLVMILLWKTKKFSPVGVSVAGGVAHNAGQIIAAIFILETGKLIYYLPVLCISGVVSGVIVGLLGGAVVSRLSAGGMFRDL